MDPPVRFALKDSERASSAWFVMKIELERMLQARREDNDGSLSEFQTSKLRGEIALLKEILDWDKEYPQ